MGRSLATVVSLVIVSGACALGAAPLSATPTAATAGPPGCAAVSSTTSPSLAQDGWDWAGEPAGTHLFCSYRAQGASRTYWVYEPPTAAPGQPLVVVLHGCSQQGQDIAYLSGFDAEAAAKGFSVVYPNQAGFTTSGTSFDGNGGYCWNWFLPEDQNRGAGEPALIAGITDTVASSLQSDRSRVFTVGVSAGAGMADVVAADYPDVFAAVGIVAGCEYRGLPCFAEPSVVPPQVSGLLAYRASRAASGASRAHVMPFFVENGDADAVVPVANAPEVVEQWQVTDAYAAHLGTVAKTVPAPFCAHRGPVTASSPVDTAASPPVVATPYDVYYFGLGRSKCNASDSSLGQLWIVHGESHAWPGGPDFDTDPHQYSQPGSDGNPQGNPEGYARVYSNPGGPDITDAMYSFFMAHPCTLREGLCAR
ncbi:MAG TPA: PHB depolymerase family esterase [Acidimicrobiales bacterium]|nr:PHB depolymerase family esterase [Acidimicrobiales bacterium]